MNNTLLVMQWKYPFDLIHCSSFIHLFAVIIFGFWNSNENCTQIIQMLVWAWVIDSLSFSYPVILHDRRHNMWDSQECSNGEHLKLRISEMYVWPTATVIILNAYKIQYYIPFRSVSKAFRTGIDQVWKSCFECSTLVHCGNWIVHFISMLLAKRVVSGRRTNMRAHKILSHPEFMLQQLTDELYHIK